MRGSRNFFQGVQTQRPENSMDNVVFISPQLISQFTEGVQWFYYRENYTCLRIQRGYFLHIFQGEGGGASNFPKGGGGGGSKC